MSLYTKVVGVTSEDRQEIIYYLSILDKIYLERELNNSFDENAIAVNVIHAYNLDDFGFEELDPKVDWKKKKDLYSKKIGYLSKDVAKSIAQKMDNGQTYDAYITALTGETHQNLGVNIYIEEHIDPNPDSDFIFEPNVHDVFRRVESKNLLNDLDFGVFFEKHTLIKYIGKSKIVKIPDYVFQINFNAFEGKEIEKINIPNTVMSIRENAFANNNIKSIRIPSSCKEIGYGAFRNNNITDIIIEEGVKKISTYAFADNKINSVIIPQSVNQILPFAFLNNEITNVEISNNNTKIGDGSFNNNNLPDNQAIFYDIDENGKYDLTRMRSYGGANKHLVIPNGVETIIGSSCSGCDLVSVTIPNSVNYIAPYAFKDNNLSHIIIPESVKFIGNSAFANNNIEIIEMRYNENSVFDISQNSFENNNQIIKLRVRKKVFDRLPNLVFEKEKVIIDIID